jgi:superfamily II DNA or RNA helicase
MFGIDIDKISINVGNINSQIVCDPKLLIELKEAFYYMNPDFEKQKKFRIAHHMKEAKKASEDHDEKREEYSLKMAQKAQEWTGKNYLFEGGVFGTGMLEDVLMWLHNRNKTYQLIDQTKRGHNIELHESSQGISTLRGHQNIALEALKRYDYRGIIYATTAWGKTIFGLRIIKDLQTPTLIISDRKVITEQWAQEIKNAFDVKSEKIPGTAGMFFYAEGYTKPVITLVSSALINKIHKPTKSAKNIQRNALLDFILKNVGLLIYDEVHHAAIGMGLYVVENTYAYHRIGLSATVGTREDRTDPEYLAKIAQVVYYASQKKLSALGFSKHITVHPIIINYPYGEVELIREENPTWAEFYNAYIGDNIRRNQTIGAVALDEAMQGNQVLILVDRIAQAHVIAQSLGNLARVVTGEDSNDYRTETITAFRKGLLKILVCSYGLAGEGFDVPQINRLIMTTGKSHNKIIQAVGRVLRQSHFSTGIIYDVVDSISPFKEHFLKRLSVYQTQGFNLENDGNTLPIWAQHYLDGAY